MSEPARIAVTVDVAVFTIREGRAMLALVERGNDPYRGMLALPGGFVDETEELDAAAARELGEETGLVVPVDSLIQLGAYGAPGRDPRGRTVSIVYWALVADLADPVGGSDAADSRLVPVDEALTIPLAFDHSVILTDAVAVLETDH
ncbi:MAG: NUDIX domain-containing protein [Acidimicrobiia bacterium]